MYIYLKQNSNNNLLFYKNGLFYKNIPFIQKKSFIFLEIY